MLEANRFWFYSLVCSMLRSLVLLNGEHMTQPEKPIKESSKSGMVESDVLRKHQLGGAKRRLVADGFDLLIPGSVTGWIRTSPAIVGVGMVISTVLSSKDMWDKLNP